MPEQVVWQLDGREVGAILFAAHRELWAEHFRECIGPMEEQSPGSGRKRQPRPKSAQVMDD